MTNRIEKYQNILFMINLIDENSKFNINIHEFPSATANISIFGSQSSGKSTLVNDAFLTCFPILDTRRNRQRCTKGVWFQNTQKFNIIDTEGFDSAERMNVDRIFQRQIALFCLALSDVLIINLWMNQIGRYQGSQVHILKAIVNAASRLIKSQTKTIIFVVKDCTPDADQEILKDQLQLTMDSILKSAPRTKDSLKFNIQYCFLSHYIHKHEAYLKDIKQLVNMIKVRRSVLKEYDPKDRIIYLNHLWENIRTNSKEIDLRVEQQALKLYIIDRIKRETIEELTNQIEESGHLKQKSFERYYQYYVKKGFFELKKKFPPYLTEQTIKTQYFFLEEELDYILQKHFTEVILPNEENRILRKTVEELRKSFQSVQLEKVINQQRKKALQDYKQIVHGHRQANVLARLFNEKINKESVGYESQVSHLFNIFQSKLQKEVNKQLDKQLKHGEFNGGKITEKVKSLCKSFQYNEWEVNLKEIWQKSSHRLLAQKIPSRIQDLSNGHSQSIWQSDKEGQIIAFHKKLENNLQNFSEGMLDFFQQQENIEQYKQKIRDKVRSQLQIALIKQRKRFHISLLMLAIVLYLASGELLFALKWLGYKKKIRRYINYFYLLIVFILFLSGVLKTKMRSQPPPQ